MWRHFNIPSTSSLLQPSTNLTSRSLRNRILFDKHWYGCNQAKAITNYPALHALISKCPLCVEPDSVLNFTTQCENIRANKIRHKTIITLKKLIFNAKQSLTAHSNSLQYFGTHYLSFITGPDPSPNTWSGLWTSTHLDTFSTSYYHYIPPLLITSLKKLVLQLGRTLTSACITI